MDCDERFTKAFQVAILQYDVNNNVDYADEETLLNTFPVGEVTFDNAHVDGIVSIPFT